MDWLEKICVALPAYNEEKTVGQVVSSVSRVVKGRFDAIIIVVDDGSTDETVQKSIEAGADVVVRHSSNEGVGCAVRTCIKTSLLYCADIICILDADGQHNPAHIPDIISPILKKEADLVIGSRFISSHSRIPLSIRVANQLMALLMSIVTRHRVTDVESGYRALTRHLARELNLLGLATFSHDMLMDATRKGYRIKEIPIDVSYFRGRVSRVVEGIVTYGITSVGCILRKAVSMLGSTSSGNHDSNDAEIIHESDRVREVERKITPHMIVSSRRVQHELEIRNRR